MTIAKRVVDMTRDEILKEFEGGEVVFRAPRRPRKLMPLTLRVHPDLLRVLGEEAKRRGVSGHTTMARILLEAAVGKPQKSLAEEIADTREPEHYLSDLSSTDSQQVRPHDWTVHQRWGGLTRDPGCPV